MNNLPNTLLSDDTAMHFRSLEELRDAHDELLSDQSMQNAPHFLDRIEEFIRWARATGAVLDVNDDRWAVQGLLDYWITVLYRAGRLPDDGILDEFDPRLAPELPDSLCPYIGLEAFQENDRDRFFGRQRLIADLIEQLTHRRLIAVIGPSGSGKSSLVLAGLLPALKAGKLPGSQEWRYYLPMVPGSRPLKRLARVMQLSTEDPSEDFQQNPRRLLSLIEESGNTPTVLIVDQFEEIFTLCTDEKVREAFINNLLSLVTAPGLRHTVILTMRSDFESFVARLPQFQRLFEQSEVRVTPLSENEVREAIEKPAKAASVGLKFEEGIVDTLLYDVLGEPAALPLLQFTLLKLWESRTHDRITWQAYRHLGNAREALARVADSFYEGLLPQDQVTVKRILLRMVRPTGGLEVTSSRIRREALYLIGEASEQIDHVLNKLIAARLVRLTERETPADTQVEIAHEALVRNWPRLVEWLEDERLAILTCQRLEIKAAEWVRLGRGRSGLLDRIQLPEAERWLADPKALYLGYDPNLLALVDASRAAVEEEERAQEAVRRQHQSLSDTAAYWNTSGRDPEALWTGKRLDEALRDLDLSKLDHFQRDFLRASILAREQVRREKERVAREREEARQRELEWARKHAEEQERRAEYQQRLAEEQARSAIHWRRLVVALAIVSLLALSAVIFGLIQQVINNNTIARSRALEETISALSMAKVTVQAGYDTAIAQLSTAAVQVSMARSTSQAIGITAQTRERAAKETSQAAQEANVASQAAQTVAAAQVSTAQAVDLAAQDANAASEVKRATAAAQVSTAAAQISTAQAVDATSVVFYSTTIAQATAVQGTSATNDAIRSTATAQMEAAQATATQEAGLRNTVEAQATQAQATTTAVQATAKAAQDVAATTQAQATAKATPQAAATTVAVTESVPIPTAEQPSVTPTPR